MTNEEQQLWNQIGALTMQVNVTRLVMMHLAARVLKEAPDPHNALRKLADDVHASIDRASPPPAAIVDKIEQSRAEIDRLLQAIELCL